MKYWSKYLLLFYHKHYVISIELNLIENPVFVTVSVFNIYGLTQVIEPKDLDVPVSCVKEMWQDIDTDRNGYLDLHEFNQIARTCYKC